jgi:hypothetical protein
MNDDEKEAAVRRAVDALESVRKNEAPWLTRSEAHMIVSVAFTHSRVWERIEELERKNERMRRALTKLHSPTNKWVLRETVQRIARAALASSPSETEHRCPSCDGPSVDVPPDPVVGRFDID